MSNEYVPPPFEEFTKEEAKAFATTNVSAEDVSAEAAIVKMYTAGRTVEEIREAFKISSGKFYEIIDRHNLPLRNGRLKKSKAGKRLQEMTKQEKRALVTDYKNGMNLTDIYKKYNINKHGTYTILNEFRVDRKVTARKAVKSSAKANVKDKHPIMFTQDSKPTGFTDRNLSNTVTVHDTSRLRTVSIPLENITGVQVSVDEVGNPVISFTCLKGTYVTL